MRCRWSVADWSLAYLAALCVSVLLAFSGTARAHDLAIDQVMLWPDRKAGELRGELTIDPELTRDKETRPTEEHERRVVEFLNTHLDLELDGQRLPLRFEVRELWMRGGATMGDVVRFRAPLAASVRALRLQARGFKAMVVSVQRVVAPSADPGSATRSPIEAFETTSWLLGKDEWTPEFQLSSGWREPGWRAGGPDVFADVKTNTAPSTQASSGGSAAGLSASSDLAKRDPGDGRAASSAGLAARFVRLGFEHILPGGFDHVLFVAGLVLSRTRRYRQVLISLSLFTLAHTITLALGHFQVVQVSPRVVEPLIAFSIFVLGVDNLRASRSADAPARGAGAPARVAPATFAASRVRYLVVFSFGLVHGLGFASALSGLAFDPNHLVLALFSFNVGVELGQVAVVALLALPLHAIRRWSELERYATLAGSAAIAVSGLVLVIDRVSQTNDAASTTVPATPAVSVFPSAPPVLSTKSL